MRWVIVVLLGLVLVPVGCGGGATDGGAERAEITPDSVSAPESNDGLGPILKALETDFEATLLRDLPLLDEAEAACISDAVLAVLQELEFASTEPTLLAEEMLAGVEAAQQHCLTPERALEVGAGLATVRTPEPAENAFLLAVRAAVEVLDVEDQALVGGGRLVCGLAAEAGSLDNLLARLTAAPEATTGLTEELAPSLGRVLEAEELLTFSTIAVATLCPES